jgi:hypothetical protein
MAAGIPMVRDCSASQYDSSTGSGEPIAAWTWMTFSTPAKRDSPAKSSGVYRSDLMAP